MVTKTKKTDDLPSMSAAELKNYFLNAGKPVIDKIIGYATRTDTSTTWNQMYENQHLVFKAIMPILQQAQDIQRIEALSIDHVLKLLSSGTIGVDDAVKLMSVLKTKAIMEGELGEDDDGHTLNIVLTKAGDKLCS